MSRKSERLAAAAALALSDAIAQNETDARIAATIGSVEPVAVEPVAVEPVAVEPVAVEPVAVEPVAVEPVAVEPVATIAAAVALSDAIAAGASRIYTFNRLHNQLGSEQHASFSSPGKGIVYIPTSMLVTVPTAGTSLTLIASDVATPGFTMTFRSITGKDMRRRFGVPGHKGSIVIHASQMPASSVEPVMLVSSLPFAVAPAQDVKHVVNTVSPLAATALRIAHASGRQLPTDADLDAARVALGIVA